MSRRRSYADPYSTLDTKVRQTMRQLSILWDEVDMSEEMRLERSNKAFTLLRKFCDKMVNGERQELVKMRNSIRKDSRKVEIMRRELEMDMYQRPAEIRDGSIALREHLKLEVEQLKKDYNQRHEDQKALIEKIVGLKRRLASDFCFEHDEHTLFPQAAFKHYTAASEKMEKEYRLRWRQIEHLQSEMRQWKAVADVVAQKVRGDDDLTELLEMNIDSDEFIFSKQIVDDLKAYHQETKPLYDHWLENIEFRWTEQFQLIKELWDKCMVPREDRHYSSVFEPAKNSEDVLARMQAERERLEKKYESCRKIYDLVEKWKSAWSEKLEIEEKRKQPDYYKKVNVLPDNKRERELQGKMKALEKEIPQAYRRHLEENPDDVIQIHGMEPADYIAHVEEDHRRELKFELQLKKEEKTRLQSPTPSRTPRTTQKRTMFRTPMSSTKMEPVAKRLNFDMDLPPCMSPATSEMISFITPTRRQLAGPKTSSPKEGVQTSSRTVETPMSKRAMTPSSMASGSSSSKKKPLTRRNF